MDNKIFDKAEEFIADKIKINTAAINVTTNSIDTAKANKEKAEKQAEKALSNGNVDEYQKTHKAIEKADATIFVHSSLLNKLKEEPMISQAEYESMVSDVMAEIAKNVDEYKAEIVALVDKMADIRDAESEVLNRGNTLLKKLQHDLYRDADRTRDQAGRMMNLQHENKRFDDFNIPSLVNSTLNNDCYKKIGGTRKVVSNSVFTSGGAVGR